MAADPIVARLRGSGGERLSGRHTRRKFAGVEVLVQVRLALVIAVTIDASTAALLPAEDIALLV